MNKVDFNKSQILTNFSVEFQNKIRYRRKQETQIQTERVEQRKAIFDSHQFKKKNFEIIKRDLAKDCMDYYRNLRNKINLINLWKKNWISLIYITLIEKDIANFTQSKYHEKKKLLQVAFGIQKFQLRYRKKQRAFGYNQEERHLWDTKA